MIHRKQPTLDEMISSVIDPIYPPSTASARPTGITNPAAVARARQHQAVKSMDRPAGAPPDVDPRELGAAMRQMQGTNVPPLGEIDPRLHRAQSRTADTLGSGSNARPQPLAPYTPGSRDVAGEMGKLPGVTLPGDFSEHGPGDADLWSGRMNREKLRSQWPNSDRLFESMVEMERQMGMGERSDAFDLYDLDPDPESYPEQHGGPPIGDPESEAAKAWRLKRGTMADQHKALSEYLKGRILRSQDADVQTFEDWRRRHYDRHPVPKRPRAGM